MNEDEEDILIKDYIENEAAFLGHVVQLISELDKYRDYLAGLSPESPVSINDMILVVEDVSDMIKKNLLVKVN
jgi:DNA integrity scanning protein DisA with diadenylate cyclase activity